MRGQAAVELIIVASLLLLVFFLLFQFGETNITESTSLAQLSEARNTADRLAKAATEVHNEGVGARRRVYITIPDRVDSSRIFIDNSTITIGVYVGGGTTDVSSRVNFAVRKGYLPTTPGSYWVWVISREGYVQIGSTLEIKPTNLYVELFPNNSTSTNLIFKNYGASDVNVTLNLYWSDSEVSAKINDTSSTSFSLSPDGSGVVNLTAVAYTNASRGLHSGYIRMTSNISENEEIPLVVNVVAPAQTPEGVSYLTVETYNNSGYTYSDAVFTSGETVYYQIRSYNSSDGLVNSTIVVRIYDSVSELMDEKIYTANAGTGVYRGNYTIPLGSSTGIWSIRVYEISGVSIAGYFIVSPLPSGLTVIGLSTTIPFYPNQRALCIDGVGNLHVVWRYSSDTIAYANSSDNGKTWRVSYTIVNSTGTKNTPSISCDGNNITVAYVNGTSSLAVFKSENNGAAFTDISPPSATVGKTVDEVSVERRGQRIYLVWGNATSATGEPSIMFLNSSDAGATWGARKAIFEGFYSSVLKMWDEYSHPTLAVNGSGGSSDLVHVAAQEAGSDTGQYYYGIYYRNSSDSGNTWNVETSIKSDSASFKYYPSITFSGTNVFVAFYDSNQVWFANSTDKGATWTASYRLSDNVNVSIYPSTSINKNSNPIVFWQQNTSAIPVYNWDVGYKNFESGAWGSFVNVTKDGKNNSYVNSFYTYDSINNRAHFVYANSTAAGLYNITYGYFVYPP